MQKLTKKKRLFINGLLDGLKPNDAAKSAGYKFPRQSAHHLLSDRQVLHNLNSRGYQANGNNCDVNGQPIKKEKIMIQDIEQIILTADNPKDLLIEIMTDPRFDLCTRIEAATALLPYFHAKKAPI
ncbi:hypothetical protein [Acinetobacter sp. MD2(2019)]|uniref:hypothetical protein n=1 Tax=Acinetobacter sp. MD2(2019) TaxID=2605273 RepID=UPI002D1F20E7|nr:hypothetical protein [Acinetobacter sp. MD2(2019)]MEB3754299.1 hypothetical protein [Acinetobacter sp. MD2(2019)]